MIVRQALALLTCCALAIPAAAQTKPAPPPPQPGAPQKPAPPPATPMAQTRAAQNPNAISVRGFATVGAITFHARDSFDAILDSHSGPLVGGGGQVLLPWGLYAEVAVARFHREGERVFLGPGNEVFPLGLPLDVTITPLEITGGWRYRHCPRPPQKPGLVRPAPPRACAPRLIPYAGAGLSSYKYVETSESSDATENVDERYTGFHLVGGAEYRVHRWIAVGGEVAWSTVPDALGAGGVSATFGEDNLGGTSVRLKISLGR